MRFFCGGGNFRIFVPKRILTHKYFKLMPNYQPSPLQSKIRIFAMIFLALAFAATFYSAFTFKTSLEQLADSFPFLAALPQIHEINMSELVALRTLTILAAITYGSAAVVLYLKRNISTTAVLSAVTIVLAILVAIVFTKIKEFSFPVSYGYNDDGYYTTVKGGMCLPSTLLPCAVMTVTVFISALLTAFSARLTKRALRAIDPANRASGEFRKAQIARVLGVIISVIALAAAIGICTMVSDEAETLAHVEEYYSR